MDIPAQHATRFHWSGVMTDAMATAYARDGYLVVENFISPEDINRMMDRSYHLIDSFDIDAHRISFSAKGQSHASSNYFMESASDISFFLEEEALDADGALVADKQGAINKIGHALHDLDPVFADISRNDDMAAMARGVGLVDPLLLQSMVICKQPHIGGEVNPHQDSTFLYTDPETCVGFWIALEDATLENGCLWAAAGGHKAHLRQRFVRNNDGPSAQMDMQMIDDRPLPECNTPLEAPKGTLVVLHGRLPHLSAANRSPHSRYAYALHLIDGTAQYASGNWLQRKSSFPLKGF